MISAKIYESLFRRHLEQKDDFPRLALSKMFENVCLFSSTGYVLASLAHSRSFAEKI